MQRDIAESTSTPLADKTVVVAQKQEDAANNDPFEQAKDGLADSLPFAPA